MNPLAVTPTSSLAELTVADGTQLTWRAWPAPEAPARATVLIVHGLGEHSGRYEHVAQRLRSWGFAVAGYDHRGHGRSQGPRGGLRHAHDMLSDLAAVVDHLRAHGAAPLILLGHSMGGLVVGRFVADALRPVDGLVMSSPALDIGLSTLNRGLLAASHALAPNLQVPNGLNPAFVSHDEAVVQAYVDDPLVHDKVTARLVRFMVDGGVRVRERAGQWSVPTLLMWAGADKLVAPAGSAAFAERAPKHAAHCHRFDHMYHEIFNEPDNEAVFEVLEHWLDRRFPAQAR